MGDCVYFSYMADDFFQMQSLNYDQNLSQAQNSKFNKDKTLKNNFASRVFFIFLNTLCTQSKISHQSVLDMDRFPFFFFLNVVSPCLI